MTARALKELIAGPPLRIHLIGVAGSGMSGLAALLLALGHRVSGSDRVDTIEVERLERKGLDFTMPHSASCVADAKLTVCSSAIKPGNAAYDEAARLGIPMVRRADALAAIMSEKKGVIICGMHGKTTTSSMMAHVLRQCGFKPSHYVGAEIPILGANARWDSEGAHFVAEGDESDGTLANYHPEHALVLNIEPEHLDFYPNLAAIDAVFAQLLDQTRGVFVYCGDDPGAVRVAASRPQGISYGTGETNTYRLDQLETENFSLRFRVLCGTRALGNITLNIPGRHNALNALGVIALATELGAPFAGVQTALEEFRGAKRRFEVVHRDSESLIVDDYGHHPTEIAATIATARTGGHQRVLVMFQPHRYSRTLALKEGFARAFDAADAVWISDIYPASEAPIPGISGQTLVDALREHGFSNARFAPDIATIHQAVANEFREGDLILSLGAGNIHEAASRLAHDMRERERLCAVMGPGLIRLHEPLSRHTTMKVGGPAQFWVEPETEEGFADLVAFCFDENIPFLVMGRGSNLLVRDGGIPGVVACLARGEFIHHTVSEDTIRAGAGVRLKQLTSIARKAGLSGFEWMEGIPGSLGGGLRMNAGAMGSQMFEQVTRIRYCDQDGNILTRSPQDLEIRYRDVPTLRKNYALSATLRGKPAPIETITRNLEAYEKQRRASQPVAACAGCIFKNPQSIPAGKLIEELNLKNLAVGQARVSDVHGNFIVNEGGASATDILELIAKIQDVAARERGISLETEVQVVGNPL